MSSSTGRDLSLFILRLVGGLIFTLHGAQKVFGAFGGKGLAATVEMMDMGVIGYLVALGEFFGGLGLILGLLSRFSAASMIVIMIGAIVTVHGKNGFFLHEGGYEYNLALIAIMAPILILGPGAWALARLVPGGRKPFIE